MPRAYSGDLRRRVVAAVLEGGQSSREAVARRFVVGRSTVYRWVEVAQSEGRLEAKPMCGGPKPTIRDEGEAALRRLVSDSNHLSLAEYRDRLAEARSRRDRGGAGPSLDAGAHPETPGPDAQKREACAPPSRTKPRSPRRERHGGAKRPPSRPSVWSSSMRAVR
jgi:transposase-like protein